MRIDGATKFLTIKEAAARARQSPRTIRRALAGEVKPLRHCRIGRRVIISETDLNHWLEDHAVMPALQPEVKEELGALFPELRSHPGVTPARGNAEKGNGHQG
jgi:excisionase family DNA binding protein